MSPELRRVLAVGRMHWPQVRLWSRQREMVESVIFNRETYVVAGNQLGKDFAAAWCCVLFFVAPWMFFPRSHFETVERRRLAEERRRGQPVPEWEFHTRKVVTTSIDGDQLRNLWGEIGRLIATSSVPLRDDRGGPLTVNQRDVSLAAERVEAGAQPLNYLIGRVTATGEGISGAHAEYNLFVVDEASGSEDMIYEFAVRWAKRLLVFGNANPTTNFFWRGVKGGDVLAGA